MTTASPASAMTQPAIHVLETRRRSMRVPNRLVNTGNVASTSAPCIAEVVDCPTVNISGNAMNAANPENASSCRAARVGGQRLTRRERERKREAAGEHGAQDADEQRVDLAGGDLGEQRRAAPDDHERERDRDGDPGLVGELA